MSDKNSSTPAGWYPSPERDGRQRYWDGGRWTEHYAPAAPHTRPVAPVGGPIAPWPPKKKSSAGKTIAIVSAAVVGGLFLIGAIGAAASGSDSTTPAADSVAPHSAPHTRQHAKAAPKAPQHARTESHEQAPKAKPAPQPSAPHYDMAVQAGQMLQDFKQNEAAADAKYDGKVLKITGHVAKVDTEFWDDHQYIVELDGGGQFAILSVNCNDVSAQQAAKVKVDNNATVIGTFDDGGDLGVEIKDCIVQ